MIYVVSDIHGCFDEYAELLERINLRDEDTLYVLGDIVDRGKDGVKVLLDMMSRPNIIPIMGNHDYLAAIIFKKLSAEITEFTAENYFDDDFTKGYSMWIADGGDSTLAAFSQLTLEQKEDILDYFTEFLMYEELCVNGRDFVLVHAGLMNFSAERKLDDYEIYELIYERADYSKVYFKDRFLVTGHTPTSLINKSENSTIYKENNHFAIDCGAIYGGKLAALCLDTLEEYYV
jgi:serine/threonine protein phosphatase 1